LLIGLLIFECRLVDWELNRGNCARPDDGTSPALLGDMTPDDLKARTKKFAVDVIRFAKAIPKDHINDEIASQLADAATSTAAHYRAVCRAKSRVDFINKLSGAVEEVDESALWLEILREAEICSDALTRPLWKEADELTRILVRSRETARARAKAAKRRAQARKVDRRQRSER
jgi:four helix bundle protein